MLLREKFKNISKIFKISSNTSYYHARTEIHTCINTQKMSTSLGAQGLYIEYLTASVAAPLLRADRPDNCR